MRRVTPVSSTATTTPLPSKPRPQRDVAADEGHALWEERRLDRVVEDTVYPDRRPFEVGERARVLSPARRAHVIVLVHHAIVVLVQPSST